jgi:cell division protein FtsB
MATTNQPPHAGAHHAGTRTHNEWAVSYNQSDVDNIRQQIEQTESAKRRWLFLALLITIAALVGAIVLLSTNYALYSSSESEKKRLVQENAALKQRLDQTQQQLDAKMAKETTEAQTRAEAQAKLDKLLPAVLNDNAGGGEVASFARMVYNLPNRRVELDRKPPDKLFRNWKVNNGRETEVYTLVGGLVDGKWVVYSNLVR